MLRTPSTRRTAFGLTAAALVGASALLGSFSASAQTTGAAPSGSAACADLAADQSPAGFKKYFQCEMDQLDQRKAAARARIDAANHRASAADARARADETRAAALLREAEAAQRGSLCIRFLTAGIVNGAFDKAEILAKAGGRVTGANACPIATAYGFGVKASLPSPAPGKVN